MFAYTFYKVDTSPIKITYMSFHYACITNNSTVYSLGDPIRPPLSYIFPYLREIC